MTRQLLCRGIGKIGGDTASRIGIAGNKLPWNLTFEGNIACGTDPRCVLVIAAVNECISAIHVLLKSPGGDESFCRCHCGNMNGRNTGTLFNVGFHKSIMVISNLGTTKRELPFRYLIVFQIPWEIRFDVIVQDCAHVTPVQPSCHVQKFKAIILWKWIGSKTKCFWDLEDFLIKNTTVHKRHGICVIWFTQFPSRRNIKFCE